LADILEFPAQREGSKPEDRTNFVILLKELYKTLKAHGLLLSITAGAQPGSAKTSYDILSVAQSVDFINLMTYDLNGPWNKITGYAAPLFSLDGNNVETCVNYWLSEGAPAEKLNLGIPFYGRSYQLEKRNFTDVVSNATGPGRAGMFSNEAGYLAHYEFCRSNFRRFYYEYQHSAYAVHDNQWVSYDSEESIYKKSQYINHIGLGGAMIWSLDADDYKGQCDKGKYPLLKALNRGLNKKIPTALKTFVCPRDGTYRHSLRSSKFYQCIHGKEYLLDCPPGLIFNAVTERCEWMNEIHMTGFSTILKKNIINAFSKLLLFIEKTFDVEHT
jgi:chitinase